MTMYRLIQGEQRLQQFRSSAFDQHYREQDLEDWLERNPTVVTDGEPLLVIGRQVTTALGGTLDLLALDADGAAVIIELKRAPTPRDVIAQVLEYAAWINGLPAEELRYIAERYLADREPPLTLPQAWAQAFGQVEEDDGQGDMFPAEVILNNRQRLIVVIEGGNDRVTQVVRYLRSQGLDITLQEYRYYQTDAGEEMLDIEMRVGAETVSSLPPAPHTEEKAIATWPPGGRKPYEVFREQLLAADELEVAPQKAAVSFYKSTRDGRIFICYFAHRPRGSRIGFRLDSLAGYLDVAGVIETLRREAPPGVQINSGNTWCILHFAPELAREIARLMVDNIISQIG